VGTTVYERRRPAASVIEHSLAGSRHRVFWIDDLPEEATRPRPRLEGAHVADLAIVGAGYTGLWAAVLAKHTNPDLRVVLVEARQVGWAASGRNGGFCEASLTHGRENGLARWPDEIDELDRLGLANLDAIEASEAEYGMDFEFERNGSLDIAVEPHQVEWLHEAVADAASRGDDSVKLLDEHQVREQVDSPVYLGAVWNTRSSAILHPAKLAAELARVAEEAGVEIFERSPVRRLDTPGSTGAVQLTTDHGRVDATRAVLATNVFPALLKRNRLMTVPVYDYVLMTEPLTAEQRAAIGWANRQGVGDLANQFH
jgi:glycine/D-amino acid oxidase-like deaminating enzyme